MRPSIATELSTNLVQLNMSQDASKKTFWDDLLKILAGLASPLGRAIGGPFASALLSASAGAVSDVLGYYLDDYFTKHPVAPTPIDLNKAAQSIQNFSQDAFYNAFLLLTNSKFITSMFSNYGLLEAMGTMQFTYSPDDKIPSANLLRQSYDESVWAQLLPRMFSWKSLSFTQASALPGFSNFIPSAENARWQNPYDIAPSNCRVFSKCWFDGWEWQDKDYTQTDALPQAESEALALQNGKSFAFPGYDFGPNDWWGPGAVSTAQTVTGNPVLFYTITTDSHIQETLDRQVLSESIHNPNKYEGTWETQARLDGVTIQEWTLVTPDGKELSPTAAGELFGGIPSGGLTLASATPQSYTGGMYYDFNVPTGGLVSRFDVFSQWGQGVNGFSPPPRSSRRARAAR